MNIKSVNYLVSVIIFLLSSSVVTFATGIIEPMEPQGIDIVRKALVNRELKKKYEPDLNQVSTSGVSNQTFSETILSKANTDPINGWVEIKIETWIEKFQSFDTKRLQECFGVDALDPIASKMRERVQCVTDHEKEHYEYFSFCHSTAPQYGFVYTVQSICKDFIDIQPSRGVWNFRWNKGQNGPQIQNVNDLKTEAKTSFLKDESDLFRRSALCAVPSIYTNFTQHSESAAQLWFTSSSVCNQQAGSVDSHIALLQKNLESLGFEKGLLFELRNAFAREAYNFYPKNGRLFQILIHAGAANDLVYLSSAFGRPCTFHISGQEVHQTSHILDAYRNNEDVKAKSRAQETDFFVPIDSVQARILFIEEYFRNPDLVKIKDHFIREQESRPQLKKCEENIQESLIKHLPCWLDTNPQTQNSYPLLTLKKYVDKGTTFYKEFYAKQDQM